MAVQTGSGAGSGSGSSAGTICVHGTIDTKGTQQIRVKVYEGTLTTPPATPSEQESTVAEMSGARWCARGVPCPVVGSSTPGAAVTVVVFEIGSDISIVNKIMVSCSAVVSTAGGTDCCTGGLCGEAASSRSAAVAQSNPGQSFPPPPPPMAAHTKS